ncbi:YraN family protein [Corynebacterium sp.]|uniref:YraN family protein n=1 Tax=Corynebacterium sp. TaxID=1720 RepID=UPI0026DC29A3|nr:YraN family protein [Corynebacterium sp.]MDO5075818.1 YraN family protein [Corynebacterium sp.]
MGSRHLAVGVAGEDAAAEFYTRNGYRIVARNVRYSCGELDLLAVGTDGELVVVEVKTRSTMAYGGAEAVTPAKLTRMRKAAAMWLLNSTDFYTAVRFDVLVVLRTPIGTRFEHYAGVDHGVR